MRLNPICQLWLGIAALLVLAGGCSLSDPKPDIVSTEKRPGREYSSEETRRMVLDHPQLLSGEYFLKRTRPEADGAGKRKARTDEGMEAAPEKAPSAAKTPKSRQAAAEAQARDAAYRRKVGLLFGQARIRSENERRLVQACAQAAPENLLLLSRSAIREVMAASECGESGYAACAARELSLFPGVRMLILPEAVALPESLPSDAHLRLQVMDAGLGFAYPPLAWQSPVSSSSEVDAFVKKAIEQALSYADRKAAVMPRHCRVFSVNSGRIFINAGRLTGLRPGGVFDFVEGGEAVRSPGGIPVAWIPGAEKGSLRVESLAGEDIALCSPAAGDMPEAGDIVLLSK